MAPSLLAQARAAGVPVALTYGLTEACSQVATAPVASLAGDGACHAAERPCRRCSAPTSRSQRTARSSCAARRSRPARSRDDGWLHTGDLGELDGAGRLSVLGRRAETIISGGENVAPAEVESVLESHPLVLEAGVFGVADEQWGEAVSARGGAAPAGRGSGGREHRGAAGPLRADAGALQGARSGSRSRRRRCHGRARASCCAGSSDDVAKRAPMTFDAEAHRRSSLENWEAAASGLAPAAGDDRRLRGAGRALDDRRRRTPAGGAGARAGGGAGGGGPARGGAASLPGAR